MQAVLRRTQSSRQALATGEPAPPDAKPSRPGRSGSTSRNDMCLSTGDPSTCPVSSSTCWPSFCRRPARSGRGEELIDRLWAGRELTDTRTLDTHVRRLRVKLEENPAAPLYLLTVRGVGFRFDPEGRPVSRA